MVGNAEVRDCDSEEVQKFAEELVNKKEDVRKVAGKIARKGKLLQLEESI